MELPLDAVPPNAWSKFPTAVAVGCRMAPVDREKERRSSGRGLGLDQRIRLGSWPHADGFAEEFSSNLVDAEPKSFEILAPETRADPSLASTAAMLTPTRRMRNLAQRFRKEG